MQKKGIIILALIALIAFAFTSCEPEWKKEIDPLTEKFEQLEAQSKKLTEAGQSKEVITASIKEIQPLRAEILEIKAKLEAAGEEALVAYQAIEDKHEGAKYILPFEKLEDFEILFEVDQVIKSLDQPIKNFLAAYKAFKANPKDGAAAQKVMKLGDDLKAIDKKFLDLKQKLSDASKDTFDKKRSDFLAANSELTAAINDLTAMQKAMKN
ncbi:MAG: hypothetical protein JW904_02360 [Spirochaetales bacterium]|nr:hypothetical protein [Spirochaetales bacterium]